jgi:hypothetical protein
MHTLFRQQPLGQFPGPQGGAEQNPPDTPLKMHISPDAAQFEHGWPPLPHANGLMPVGLHICPEQHPRPQLFGPHCGCGAQKPPVGNVELHFSPICKQFEHCCPPVPHAVSVLPPFMQRFPEQHPGQPGPHCGITIMHCCEFGSQVLKPSARQFWQATPAVPQAVASRPVWHTPLTSQQPFGQLNESQPPVSGGKVSSPGASLKSSPPSCGTT